MTLYDFLSKFTTEDVKVVIKAGEENICTIFSYGADALDEYYKESKIVSWELTNAKTITIVLEVANVSG